MIITNKDIHHNYYNLSENNQKDSTITPILSLTDDEQHSRATTPILPSVDNEQHSTATTPILPSVYNEQNIMVIDDPLDIYTNKTPLKKNNLASIHGFHQLPPDTIHDKIVKNCETMLIKQGKQIHALYELQKSTHEKLTWIQNQIKAQNKKKENIDLSEKVFNVSDISTSLYHTMFIMTVIYLLLYTNTGGI